MSNFTKLISILPRNKVFLGGTCTSNWRNKLLTKLDESGIMYFNPVVDDWTPECIEVEDDEKNNKCNIHLYYIDSSMSGVYSIAELVKSCYDTILKSNVDLVLFVVNSDGFSDSQIRSFNAVGRLVKMVTDKVIYELTNKDEFIDDLYKLILKSSEIDFE